MAGAAGVTAGTTAACGLRIGSPPRGPARSRAPAPSTDEQALGRALQHADGLAAAYDRAVLVRPDLATALRQLGSDHAAHVRVLRPLAGPAAASAASAGTSTTPTSSPTPSSAAPDQLTAATALSLLAQTERAATAAALTDLEQISAPAARLLASVAACGTAHVGLLGRLPRTARAGS
jgi:hypothetical protein